MFDTLTSISDIVDAWRIARKFGTKRLLNLYKKILLARNIESRVEEEYEKIRKAGNEVRFLVYATGQEAGPVAVCDLLKKEDYLIPAYRGVAAVVGKGMAPMKIIAEVLSRSGGPLKGISNAGSFTEPSPGIFPNSDILGNNFGTAVGMGLAIAGQSNGHIVTIFFGDGASTRSTFYGALNLSALWDLPIFWVCENNKYSLATRYDSSSRTGIAEKARAFGIRSEVIDGNNAVKIFLKAEELINYVRKERKPAFLELDTYRIARGSFVEDTVRYIDEKERRAWMARDSILLFKKTILQSGLFSNCELDEVENEVEKVLEKEMAAALETPPLSVNEIRALFQQNDRSKTETPSPAAVLPEASDGDKITMVEALRQALGEEMGKNERIVVFGTDVGFYGGRKGVTDGLLQRFGKRRVIDTPINEELFVAIAIGLAQAGFRPVAEFAHASFLTLAASDIHRSGFWETINHGMFTVPIVIRAVSGGGYEVYGEELGFSPISAFLNWKGIRMAAPSNAFQAKGLLKSALCSDSPIIFFEHRRLYKDAHWVPRLDYALPLDKGVIARSGKDASILAYGYLTRLALRASEVLASDFGIQTEIVDLVSLKPLDKELIISSVKKTKKALILDEEPAHSAGLFSVLYTLIKKDLPEAKIIGLGGEDVPLPFSALAKEFLPDVQKIVQAVRVLLTE